MGDTALFAKDAREQAKTTRLLLLYFNARPASAIFERLSPCGHAVMMYPLTAALEGWPEQIDPCLVIIVADGIRFGLAETCAAIRGRTGLPIVVLADACDERIVPRVLASGADEFVAMPVSDQELSTRIDALLRRSRAPAHDRWQAGGLTLCASDLSVEAAGRRVLLTPMEFRLLSCLASAPGKVFTHDTLMSRVWGAEYVDARHYLYLYIRYLREKLEQDAKQPRIIVSEWGVGYRLADLTP